MFLFFLILVVDVAESEVNDCFEGLLGSVSWSESLFPEVRNSCGNIRCVSLIDVSMVFSC